ncbi:MAG: hypothetical protein RBQ97_09280, partial [Acholeplasma sp.]|nr:hypothetical protein [Acholeplasma sp.]
NNITIDEIIRFNEPLDEAYFVPKSITVNKFLDIMSKNNYIKVWIMTENGDKDLKPMKLITPYDYDSVFKSITK